MISLGNPSTTVPRRWRRGRGLLTSTLALAAGLSLAGLAMAPPAAADSDREHVDYTVKPGDTATGIATRLHAWTAELISVNDLGPSATLRVGETITVPVVLSALDPGEVPGRPETAGDEAEPRRAAPQKPAVRTPPRHSRDDVRRTIERTARSWGVDPALALALSWQESGWQQHVVSSADAIGAMQVLPGTAEWMSPRAGRTLDPRDLQDNVTAGVALLDLLTSLEPERRALAAYYQGLAGLREHGPYDDTRSYVRNVMALKERFDRKIDR
ncbi:transglycosylase SLT domain-containing protein [Nocardioides massiliensis]|uniref:Murein DD-endopeptidase MepM/ murein hydrolase activator NlpD n=1 Tax=Nocardioides massiliensis TaxID=1325935 RepID=A0ABT9NTB3_9ACTN|nr:transglycosylase SLT domain-containing protein [Nocardioides massiliensis]MDP9823532.1 murein DD-endopeptidase MepM/ murein hydrolase activator NlpD [Nocardioides massiliensis]